MIDRFATSDTGQEVLRRASELSVRMYRNESGGVTAHYELSGSVAATEPEGDDLVAIAQPDDLRFLRRLMAVFEGERQ